MRKQFLTWTLAIVLLALMSAPVGAEEWAIKADVSESCSCNPTCPCVFGSPPTLGHCDAVGLAEIEKGHYGDVVLDGISFVYTTRFGKWMKYTVSEEATDKQADAVGKLFGAAYGMGKVEVLSSVKGHLTIEKTDGNVKFSAPGSTVEIEIVRGSNGQPIVIDNLPAEGVPFPHLNEYTQHKSVTLKHDSEDKEFSYSGTNGFTANIDAKGGE